MASGSDAKLARLRASLRLSFRYFRGFGKLWRTAALAGAAAIAMACSANGGATGASGTLARLDVGRAAGELFSDPKVRALAEAAAKGKLDEVRRLAGEGVDVDARGRGEVTPLFVALQNLSGFTLLLELGADPNVVVDNGTSVMHAAAGGRDPRFLEVVLQHGGDPNLEAGAWPLGGPPIFEALGSIRSVTLLENAGANIDARAANEDTPVMRAAGRGRFDVVYFLLEQGADYKLRNQAGEGLPDAVVTGRRLLVFDPAMAPWMEKVVAWLEARGVMVPDDD